MGFDELFENRHKEKKHGHYNDHYDRFRNDNNYYRQDDHYHDLRYSSHDRHDGHHEFSGLIEKLRNNPRLKRYAVIAGILLILVILIFVIALFPLLIKLVNYISTYGLQGVVDAVVDFINKLWAGQSK